LKRVVINDGVEVDDALSQDLKMMMDDPDNDGVNIKRYFRCDCHLLQLICRLQHQVRRMGLGGIHFLSSCGV